MVANILFCFTNYKWNKSSFHSPLISQVKYHLKKRDRLRNKFGVPGFYDQLVGKMTRTRNQAGPEGFQHMPPLPLGFHWAVLSRRGMNTFVFLSSIKWNQILGASDGNCKVSVVHLRYYTLCVQSLFCITFITFVRSFASKYKSKVCLTWETGK